MCGLCGALGGAEHWTAGAGRLSLGSTRRAERQERVRISNVLLHTQRMRLDDWQGSSYQLASATGKTEMLQSLPEVWPAAQRLSGRSIDPLDPALLAQLLAGTPE